MVDEGCEAIVKSEEHDDIQGAASESSIQGTIYDPYINTVLTEESDDEDDNFLASVSELEGYLKKAHQKTRKMGRGMNMNMVVGMNLALII
jgi:hypothetical protein